MHTLNPKGYSLYSKFGDKIHFKNSIQSNTSETNDINPDNIYNVNTEDVELFLESTYYRECQNQTHEMMAKEKC